MINAHQAQQRAAVADGAEKVLAYVRELVETRTDWAAPDTQAGAVMLLMAAASIAPNKKAFMQAARFIFDELRGARPNGKRAIATQ